MTAKTFFSSDRWKIVFFKSINQNYILIQASRLDVFFPLYDFKSAGFFWALSLFLNFQFNVVCSVFFPLLAQKAPFWLWKVLNSPPEAFKCMFFQANTVDKMASEVVCIFGLRKMCRIYKITEIGNINISRYSSSCRK